MLFQIKHFETNSASTKWMWDCLISFGTMCENCETDDVKDWCQPILNQHHKNTFKKNTKPQTLRFSSHTSPFWTLPDKFSILHHALVPTHPEPTSQKYTTKPQTLRFSSHTSPFEQCRTSSPSFTAHWCQPILNQHHKNAFKKNTKPQTPRFSSHTSPFWTLPDKFSILHHALVPTHPEPTSQKYI